MPSRLTAAELLNEINRYETGSGASQAFRVAQLADMQATYDEVISHGDRVSTTGWWWNMHEADVTPTFNAGNPVTLDITAPTARRLLTLRMGDTPTGVVTLRQVDPLWADRVVFDKAETGAPSRYWIYGYDEENGYWQIWLHPFYSTAPTEPIIVRYQGNPPALTDSNVQADTVIIPETLRRVLLWGTLSKRFILNDRTSKFSQAKKMYDKALQDLVIHHHAMKERPDMIRPESEYRYLGMQDDMRYDSSRTNLW